MGQKYYSASAGGFFDSDIHGERELREADPNWIATEEGAAAPLVAAPNPMCLIPVDAIEITSERYADLLAQQSVGKRISAGSDGIPVAQDPPPPSTDEIKRQLISAVQRQLDSTAQSFGYDSIITAVTYAEESGVAKFQTEGKALRAWRSKVWAACYLVMADVEASKRAIPSAPALIAELPTFSL